MVTKINISLKNVLLERTDKEARESHTSRSALIAKAMEHWLEDREEERLKEQRRKAAEGIDMIREKLGAWDATGEVLKWRQPHQSHKDAWTQRSDE